MPTSMRSRVIHFYISALKSELTELVAFHFGSNKRRRDHMLPVGHDHGYHLPDSKRRCTASASLKKPSTFPMEPSVSGNDGHANMYSGSSTFAEFVSKLITNGTIQWRLHKLGTDVLVMNDAETETGVLMPNAFVHVTRIQREDTVSYSCSCDMYGVITSSSESSALMCLHCRFVKEYVDQHLPYLFSGRLDHANNLTEVLHGATLSANQAICELPSVFQIKKFSVIDQQQQDMTPSVVHLHGTEGFIHCMDGRCKLASKSRKHAKQLLSADNLTLCQHLFLMKENRQKWETHCGEGV